jgi:hypothetical protein
MSAAPASAREALLAELGGEEQYGVLLLAQIGGAPNELQLIVETARYDPAVEGLRPQHDYVIRALGVLEHRLTLGVFGAAALTGEHPLLLHHNTPRTALHFSGTPGDVSELVLDISQAYVSTFGPWRHVVEMPDDLNRALPLVDLLQKGAGLLGTMPKPLAERMARVLAHHGLQTSLSEDAAFRERDEHGRSTLAQALVLDNSYVLALDFSVERMGRR